jgi:hypothetical protein
MTAVSESGASPWLSVLALDLSPVSAAILLTLLFTSLVCLIEVPSRAQASLRACLSWPFVVYLFIFLS